MHSKPSLQTIRLVCLLIAAAWTICPLTGKAQETTTTAPPAVVTAPEATNPPPPTTVPETTNAPAPAPAPEATNTPAPATAPETTNAPAPAATTAITNAPETPMVSTNTPATTNPPPAVIVPAATVAPMSTNATPETTTAATPAPKTVIKPKATKRPLYQPFTLDAEAGTTGVGGGAGWRFADHFGLVGGMDYLKYSMNRSINDIPYNAKLNLQSEYAALNVYPSRHSSFHFSLGAYFNQNRLNGTAVSDGSLNVNGVLVPPGDSVLLEYKQQPVDPYVSIGGNLYFDKGHHFSLGGELGAFYLGNPKVHLSDSENLVPQADLDAQKQKLVNDIKKVPVWPILKISLNYSF